MNDGVSVFGPLSVGVPVDDAVTNAHATDAIVPSGSDAVPDRLTVEPATTTWLLPALTVGAVFGIE